MYAIKTAFYLFAVILQRENKTKHFINNNLNNMKKIFTLVMLSIFTVMNVNAEEQVLWEGDYAIDWSSAWEPNNLATPILTKEDMGAQQLSNPDLDKRGVRQL